MRSTAFNDADLIIVLGTRMNYIIGHAAPPRFGANAKIARIDIDADEIASAPRKIDIGIVGDCKAVLQQLLAAMPRRIEPENFAQWRKKLAEGEAAKRKETGGGMSMNKTPIHPLRLCEEVKNFMKRDAILVVDGQEILNYGRQSMPTFSPGHRLNSGPFGMMGVGMPFGVGAKIACPDKQVIVVHGDGSFGLNAMELDTAVRHKAPVLVVISLNGGWTADPKKEEDRAQSRLHPLRQDGRGARLLRRVRGEARRHRTGARACAEESRSGHGRARQRRDRRHGTRRHGLVLVSCGRGNLTPRE